VPSLTVLTAIWIGPYATADVVRLKGGGEVHGSLEGAASARAAADFDRLPEVVVKTLAGARVTIQRADIESLELRPIKVEEYERRARTVADDVSARWELAEWCRAQGLKPQREEQLSLILELDSEHEKAHYALGHSRPEGKWVSREEVLRDRGVVVHKGRVVSLEERRLIEEADAVRAEERKWFKQVRLWHTWLTGSNPERSRRGLDELQRIDDPNAVRALANFLGDDDDERVRELLVKILSRIPGPKPASLLVDTSLHDANSGVRAAALEVAVKNQRDMVRPLYIRALKSPLNETVRRAGAALRQIGDEASVPALIEALVTTHRYRVKTVDRSSTISLSVGGSFAPPDGTVALPPDVAAGALLGQYPNGLILDNSRMSPRPVRYVTVRRHERNPEVLAALENLTGQSLEYDEAAWRLWWSARKSGTAPAASMP
jgi:hypothetical protein